MQTLKLGLLTISDRAKKGIYQDRSGPAMRDCLQALISSPMQFLTKTIADEQDKIIEQLRQWVDEQKCQLILTSGGTGPTIRDVTPEATLAVAEKIMYGFGERMRSISLQYTKNAILSRQTAVIRKQCLIVNLPGSPQSIKEILDELFSAIFHCINLLNGPLIKTNARDCIFRKQP